MEISRTLHISDRRGQRYGEAYRIQIESKDIQGDPAVPLVKRIDAELRDNRSLSGLDRSRVMSVLFKRFSTWKTLDDLPKETAAAAEQVFNLLARKLGKLES